MLRSVVVPGWGQWANGKKVKAGIVALGEGYLLYSAIHWGRVERRARDNASASAGNLPLQAMYKAEADRAGSHRRDFTWWTIFAAALSMGDAYVDAHLRNFDIQFKPQDEARLLEPSLTCAVRVSLP